MVLVFDRAGAVVRRIKWPIPDVYCSLRHVALKSGVLIGELDDGQRIYVRVNPKSTADPEGMVTEGDIGFGGDIPNSDIRSKDRQGYAVLGAIPYPDKTKDRETKMSLRKKRSRGWQGKTLMIRDLPYYRFDERPQIGDWDKPGLKDWNVLKLVEGGSVWAEVGISNPFGYTKKVLLDEDSTAVKGCPMIMLFDSKGALRGYVVIRPPMRNPIIPIGDALYVTTGDWLVRWEPMRR